MAFIEIKNLSFQYNSRSVPALKNVSLDIDEGSFILITGRSGSGKSTLLKMLKSELNPAGKMTGTVTLYGTNVKDMAIAQSARAIGYVFQNPDNQIVTDKVFSELCFGLNNLGFSDDEIELKVAEMSEYFGINRWQTDDISSLSGGQKQILNIASVMLMQPQVLILDEPTSQLDPSAATELTGLIKRINSEFGVTVIMTQHRAEDVFSIADSIVIMDGGEVVCNKKPRELADSAAYILAGHNIPDFLPAPVRVFSGQNTGIQMPLTVSEAQKELKKLIKTGGPASKPARAFVREKEEKSDCVITVKDVYFRYEKNSPDILKGLNLTVKKGEIFCIMGGNGAGKSTAFSVIAGLKKPYAGSVKILDKKTKDYKNGSLYDGLLAGLPQNPYNLFIGDSLREDLALMSTDQAKIDGVASLTGIGALLDFHPYDLSGGEAQKAAFAKVLLASPQIILLDEPTKGLDAGFKKEFGAILKKLAGSGTTILCATHDTDFAAEFSDKCCLFFDGRLTAAASPEDFFNNNYFYTTAANRIARAAGLRSVTADALKEELNSSL